MQGEGRVNEWERVRGPLALGSDGAHANWPQMLLTLSTVMWAVLGRWLTSRLTNWLSKWSSGSHSTEWLIGLAQANSGHLICREFDFGLDWTFRGAVWQYGRGTRPLATISIWQLSLRLITTIRVFICSDFRQLPLASKQTYLRFSRSFISMQKDAKNSIYFISRYAFWGNNAERNTNLKLNLRTRFKIPLHLKVTNNTYTNIM